jgi:NSS family neurotransmitter:Na+ symporter
MSKKRENWGTQIGLILAMAGNAVGLGNFWRFPFQAAQNGGGAFMIPYIAALFIIGIPVMMVEWMQGRFGGQHGHGTLGFMVYLQSKAKIKPKRALILGSVCGAMVIAVTVLVNSYYNHIIGWTLGYSYLSVTGQYMGPGVDTTAIFVNYISSPIYIFVFWIISLSALAFAVTRGIQKGIEAWAKLMMPVLYVFGFILIFKALTVGAPIQPQWSSLKGLDYLWHPDFSKLDWKATLAASGQIFFTLSIGMGIIQNYASYLKKDDELVVSALATVSLNEFAEVVLGGTIAIPIGYAFLGPDKVQSGGAGFSFIALPSVFNQMGISGQVFGAMWFLLLFFAGFTSAIAMYNYLVSIFSEDIGLSRKKASFAVFALYIIVGLPVGLEPIIHKANTFYLDEVDRWVGSYLLVIIGLLEVLITGWLMKDDFLEEVNRGSYWKLPKWFYNIVIKFVTPFAILFILIGSTYQYAKEGYFKLIPTFALKSPESIPWVNGARIMIIFVLLIGFLGTLRSIKAVYGDEINGKNSIKK